MKSKAEKAEEIELLREKFGRAKGVVFTDYKGLTVAEISEMRRMLRGADVEYRVVKNTLARIAADDTAVAPAKEMFDGPVGLAIGYDDPVVVAQKIIDFAKKNEKFGITGGVVEGRVVDADALRAVAKLPPREVQLGMLAGAMASPLSKMASLLQAPGRKLAYALQALKEQKQ